MTHWHTYLRRAQHTVFTWWGWARRLWRLWALLAALLVLVLVGLGLFAYFTTDQGDITEGSVNMTSTYREVPPGYYEYRTSAYHFSILFPKELAVKEYGGNGDSLTVTFGEGSDQSFQIFATPYNKPVVDGERFGKDNPSGVYNLPEDAIVGGVRATIFFSQAPGLGETREAWFIRKGILYEANARKKDDEWLGRIMQSWMFVD